MSVTVGAEATTGAAPLEDFSMPGRYRSLLERWDDVVRAHPDGLAFASADARYGFAEADRLSDLMALDLVAALGDDESPIGLVSGQTAETLVAIMAVLKTGRMHVVLDLHLPTERHRQIVDLAGLTTVIADTAGADAAAALSGIVSSHSLEKLLADAAASTVTEADLASHVSSALTLGRSRRDRDGFGIVFTSGSTGIPKGVVQTHQEGLNESTIHRGYCQVGPDDRALLVLPLAFVAGIQTLFSLALNGVSLWCFDPRDSGVQALADFVEQNRLTTFASTPYLARSMGEAMAPGRVLSSLRYVWTGGEAVTGRDIGVIRTFLSPEASFINCLGSTEGAVLALWRLRSDEPVPSGPIPSGRTVVNKAIRILREDGSEAEPGETGQIAIVSDYIAGGYWNDPVKDAEAFRIDDDGARYFLQGDLGRIDAQGDLVLGGRADAAVKVRGYLVEPAEVEAGLVSIDEVADAVVTAVRADGVATRLVAYVVPKEGVRVLSNAALRRSLRSRLPEYMVPSDIVQLSVLPRTERGKVDRKALPEVPARRSNVEEMDPREFALSAIWQEVLGLPELHLDDDFLALGGDSLSAEEMLTLVEEYFGVVIPSFDVIEYPTLREFSKRIGWGRGALPSHPDVLTLNSGGSETPLFCFAGAAALALCFFPLSKRLPDTPVYAFQAHGIERRAIPDRTIEAMATRALQLMRIVRPHGPYRVVGHSFGGYVALEVARMLTQAGETVERLVILDSLDPVDVESEDAGTGVAAPAAGHTLRGLVTDLRARFLPDGLPSRANLTRQLWAHLAGVVHHDGPRQYDSYFDLSILQLRRYTVRPYSGAATLVLSGENPNGDAAWSRVLTGDLEVFAMKADHDSILLEPHVAELAGHLTEVFDRPRAG